MLRSYLEKNDEFVNEEAFAKEIVQKFGPKLLESFPELWNEKVERIERLRAETNLNIKGKGDKLSLITKILDFTIIGIKGSSDPSHFIFEINVGKRRIRHGTTLKLKL